MSKEKLAYSVYLKKHEEISKYEQANYDSYEKTILTLSAAFLAFSVSFLGFLRRKTDTGAEVATLLSEHLLIWSWVCFAASILCMLVCFPVSAFSHRAEVTKLEKALEDASSLDEQNRWSWWAYFLYVVSGAAFVCGLILLLIFCGRNIRSF